MFEGPTHCKNCGRPLPEESDSNYYIRSHGFCSEGCMIRFKNAEADQEQHQRQVRQQRQAEEKQAQELFRQRFAAMRRDPRSKEFELMRPLFPKTDAEVLQEYMARYGDPLRNPSLAESQAQPEPPPPRSQPKKNFFDSDDDDVGGSILSDDNDLDEEQENLAEIFVKLALASMADDMKALLLQGKVDSSILCYRALSALIASKVTASREVIDLLLTFGDLKPKYRYSVWPDIVRFRMTDVAQQALARGAKIDADPKFKTALMLAIEEHDPAMVKFLLEQGADPNYFDSGFFADNDGLPPLAIAERDGLTEIATILREHGASPTAEL